MASKKAYDIAFKLGAKMDKSFGNVFNTAEELASKTVGKLIKTAAAIGGALISADAIKDTVDKAMQFESAMADVAKVVDGLKDESGKATEAYAAMSNEILDMTARIPMAADEITKLISAAGQSGIAADELTKFAEDAAKMGVAFDLPADRAGELAAVIRSSLGLTQDEFVTLADKINFFGNTTTQSADKLIEVVQATGLIGKQAGVNADQIAAMGAAMNGMDASNMGTALANIYGSLMDGSGATDTAKAAWKKLGFTSKQVAKDMLVDSEGTMIKIFEAMKELPADQLSSTTAAIFGNNKSTKMAIASFTENLDALKQNFNSIGDATLYAGSMQNEFNTRAATTENSIQLAKNAIDRMKISLGTLLLPTVAKGANLFANALNGLTKKIPAFISKIKNLWKNIKVALNLDESIKKLRQSFIPSILEFRNKASAAFDGIKGVATTAFSNVAAVIEKHQPTIDKLVAVAQDLKEKLFQAFEYAKPAITWIFEEGLPKVCDILFSALGYAADVYNFMNDNWSLIGPIIYGIVGALTAYKAIQIAIQAWTVIMTAKQWLLNAAMSANPIGLVCIAIGVLIAGIILLVRHWDKVREVMGKVADELKTRFQPAIDWFSSVWQGAVKIFSSIWEKIGGPITAAVENIKTSLGSLLSKAGSTAVGIKAWFINAFNTLRDTAISPIERIKSVFGSLGDKIGEVIGKITSWFGDTFTGFDINTGMMLLRLKGLIGPIGTVVKMFLGNPFGKWTLGIGGLIAIFSTLMANEGDVTGFVDTIKAKIGEFFEVVKNVVAQIVSKLPELVDGFMGIVNSVVQVVMDALPEFLAAGMGILTSLIDGIMDVLPTLMETALSVITTIIDSITENLPKVIEMGVSILSSLLDGIVSILPQLTETAISLLTSIIDTITTNLPKIIEAGVGILTTLISGITNTLPQITGVILDVVNAVIGAITDNLPMIVEAGISILTSLIQGITDIIPQLVETAVGLLNSIISTITENLPTIIEAGISILTCILNGIMQVLPDITAAILDVITAIISAVTENLPLILEAGISILTSIIQGITDMLPQLTTTALTLVSQIITAITDSLPQIIEAGIQILNSLIQGIIDSLPEIVTAVLTLITSLITAITENLPKIIEAGVSILNMLIQGIVDTLPTLITTAIDLINSIFNTLVENLPAIIDAGLQILMSLISGIIDNLPEIVTAVINIVTQLISSLTERLPEIISMGIQMLMSLVTGLIDAIPELIARLPEIITAVVTGLASLGGELLSAGASIGASIWEGISGSLSDIGTWFMDVFAGAWQGVKDIFSKGGEIFSGIGEGILGAFKTIVNGIIDGINFVIAIPFDGINAALEGIKGVDIFGFKPFDWLPTIGVPQIPKLAQGGLAYGPTMAVVGDNKNADVDPEVIAPLSRITAMLKESISKGFENGNIFERLSTVPKAISKLFPGAMGDLFNSPKNLSRYGNLDSPGGFGRTLPQGASGNTAPSIEFHYSPQIQVDGSGQSAEDIKRTIAELLRETYPEIAQIVRDVIESTKTREERLANA